MERRGRRGVHAVVASAITAALVAAPVGQSATAAASLRHRMLKLINGSRQDHGLPALKLNVRLSKEAKQHTRDMVAAGQLFHTADLGDLMHWAWSTAAENIGCGGSVRSVHRAFMDSAPHRDNILDPDFRKVGLGVLPGGSTCGGGSVWATEDFYG